MVSYTRQLGWFDPAKHQAPITVVGAGGIGGPTTLALAKLGLRRIKVYDYDKVDAHNQPNQIFGLVHVSDRKVDALAAITRLLGDVSIKKAGKKVTASTPLSGVVVSGVDSMDARRAIWAAVKGNPKVPLYVDGRIGGQVIRVITVRPGNRSDIRRYEATLVPNHAVAPMLCTEAGIIDISFSVAAIITRAVRMFLTKKDRTFDVTYDQRNLRFYKEI